MIWVTKVFSFNSSLYIKSNIGLDIACCFCSNGDPYYPTLILFLKWATCTCEWGGGQLTLLYTKSYAYNNNIQENVIK